MIGHNLAVAYRPKLVDVGRLTLRAALDDTLARVVLFLVQSGSGRRNLGNVLIINWQMSPETR